MIGKQPREEGQLQTEVLAALWAAGHPQTTADVMNRLGHASTYTTIQTVLSRLYVRGAVSRQVRGRAHAYTPLWSEADLLAQRLRAVADGSPATLDAVLYFVKNLSEEEQQTVRDACDHLPHI